MSLQSQLLKEGTRHLAGVDEAVLKNVDAVREMSKITRTSLGPQGAFIRSQPPFWLLDVPKWPHTIPHWSNLATPTLLATIPPHACIFKQSTKGM
jgi:hypothetical protein